MANNDKLKKQDTAAPSIAEHKKFQKTLLDTLQENNVTDTHISLWANQLWALQEAYTKILYSDLSASILEENNDDKIIAIKDNLNKISDYMDSEYTGKNIKIEQYLFWLKYKDHCELAILQRKHYNLSKGTIKTYVEDIIKPETDRIQKDLTSQLIGLVSLFTALSFVVFGGINILDSVLENIRLATVTRMLTAGSTWTLCMTFLFYIFIRFILKVMKPEQDNVLGKQFMKSFWIMFGVVAAITVGFMVMSFAAPSLFAFI